MQWKWRLCLCFIQGRERIFEFAGANQAGCISMPETDHWSLCWPLSWCWNDSWVIPEWNQAPHWWPSPGHQTKLRHELTPFSLSQMCFVSSHSFFSLFDVKFSRVFFLGWVPNFFSLETGLHPSSWEHFVSAPCPSSINTGEFINLCKGQVFSEKKKKF